MPKTASTAATCAPRRAATVFPTWSAKKASMLVRHVVSNVRQSAACALTRWPATAHFQNSFVRFVRTFATGAQKSAAHTTWITARAAPRLVVIAPQRAAKWPLNQTEVDLIRQQGNRKTTARGKVWPMQGLADMQQLSSRGGGFSQCCCGVGADQNETQGATRASELQFGLMPV